MLKANAGVQRGLRLLVRGLACGIGLSAYVGLAAEDFCNPVREHGTPGEHGLVSMAVA